MSQIKWMLYLHQDPNMTHTAEKLVLDLALDTNENKYQTLARVLKYITNYVHPDVVMEEDHPGKHSDSKMPILDMKVWLDKEAFILYEHYQ